MNHHLHSACESVDASVFSGDVLWDDDSRTKLKEYVERWQRAIVEHEVVAPPAMAWPKARDVGRYGDMHPRAHIRVGLDSENDAYVSVWDEDGGGSVEFCNQGGGGGGSSSRTRLALIALMVAIEADNAERPDKDWWARRNGKTQAGGGE